MTWSVLTSDTVLRICSAYSLAVSVKHEAAICPLH